MQLSYALANMAVFTGFPGDSVVPGHFFYLK